MLQQAVSVYNQSQDDVHGAICQKLAEVIQSHLPGSKHKIWHAHPVWFLDDNPIVGYSVQKQGVRLMFWSGRSFHDDELIAKSRFQDASIFYQHVEDIDEKKIIHWLELSKHIQWDYKNIVLRKGKLEKLTNF